MKGQNQFYCLFVIALLFIAPATSFAQPANDECSAAILLTSSTSCVNTAGTNVNGTYNPSTITAIGCGASDKYDVWYSFVAQSSTHTITLSSAPGNIRVQLFSGTCGAFTSLACGNSTITYTALTNGNTYYIRVYTQSNSSAGTFNICVTHTPPANDNCAGAISLTSNPTCVNTAGTLNSATANGATPLGCFAAGTYYDVWYSFVAAATTETVTISSLGANFTNPQLQIYTSACAALGAPVCGTTTITQTGLTIGTTYKIRVANLNADPSGIGTVADFNICVTHTPPANDECAGAISLTSGLACVNTAGTLVGASYTTISTIGCGVASRNDVWYSFVAVSANTTITLSSAPANPRIQLFSGPCGSLASIACGTNTLAATGLTVGTTYYVRIYTDPNTIIAANTFNICVTHTLPANDECAGAISLTSYTGCVYTAGTLNLATANGATPLGCFAAGTYYDVWYYFVAAATTQTVTISGLGANITNPQIQIYTNACVALGTPVCGTTTVTQGGLVIGTTYRIRVSNLNADPSGNGTASNFNICVTHTGLVNDQCLAATTLTSGTSCVTTAGAITALATYTPIPSLGCAAGNIDVWYSFVAQSPNPTITSANGTARQRTQLFSGSCGALTPLLCGSNGATSVINATCLTVGVTYYVRVWSSNGSFFTFDICVTDPAASAAPSNDNCSGATTLTPGASCVNTAGTLAGATVSSPSVSSTCAGTPGADVWYVFTATSAFPTITLSSIGSNICTSYIQLFSNSCGSLTEIACASGTSLLTPGTGLTVGSTYYVRIYSPSTINAGTGYTFNICITNPGAASTAVIDYSKSYVNITKLATGGSVEPGDELEIRATFVVRSGTVDSIAFYDTLQANNGFRLLSSTISTQTNEGKVYKSFTDNYDSDGGWRSVLGSDTTIQINLGPTATSTFRGTLSNTSRPSFYGGTCIIMATYRVQVYAGYDTKINWGGGAFTYRDRSTGNMKLIPFKNDSLVVYVSPGLCSGSLSGNNQVGIETSGTFSTGAVPRNRGTSTAVPGYTYAPFATGGAGPNDYYYGVANNTSSTYTTNNAIAKPIANFRTFSVWDIIGDHTGASNTAKGNPPCDTTLPVSATNPCGYMLVVNAAYKTDTAVRATITNLCPNTYYEISAWVRNVCYKCGCDSVGRNHANAGYIPFAINDSSGVPPNLAFQINGQDYYQTGNIYYNGTGPGITQQASDTVNSWVKRGFVYKTEATQTGFEFLIRNNAPGGGGNDWAIDDIALSTCLPVMTYSPTLTPLTCDSNYVSIYDTIRSTYENYTNYKWQRSTDDGATWTDISGASGVGTPTWNGTAWEYVTNYDIPPTSTLVSDSGDLYRMIVATTTSNLANSNCQFTESINFVTLSVIDCLVPLNIDLLSFNGKLLDKHGQLYWSTSKEDDPVNFEIEKSSDGITFAKIASMAGYNNLQSKVNYYSFTDPEIFSGKKWYRIVLTNKSSKKKYSRTIALSKEENEFGLTNVINPFRNELIFHISSTENKKIDVMLVDLSGKPVKNKSYVVYAGINSFSLENTSSLPSGIYILQIKNKNIIMSTKVMKK